MKKLACRDVVSGCPAVFEADSEDAILAEVARHAAADHGVSDISTELLVAVRAAIIDL